MIAKCIKTEREGRKVFYGAMISESVIALVWAAAGVSFYGTTQLLNDARCSHELPVSFNKKYKKSLIFFQKTIDKLVLLCYSVANKLISDVINH